MGRIEFKFQLNVHLTCNEMTTALSLRPTLYHSSRLVSIFFSS